MEDLEKESSSGGRTEDAARPAVPYKCLAEISLGLQTSFAFLLLLLLVSYFTTSVHEPELFWHLGIGTWILENQVLPLENHFTYVGQQLEFYSVSWLFDTMNASIYRRFGFHGLLFSKVSLIAIFIALLARGLFKYSKSRFVSGLLLAVICSGVLVRSQLTPELFAYIYFILFCDWTFQVLSGRAKTRDILAMFPLSVFAANANISIVIGCAACVCVCMLLGFKSKSTTFIQIALLFFLLLAATYFTPYRGSDVLFASHLIISFVVSEVFTGGDLGSIVDYPIAILTLLSTAIFVVYFRNKSSFSRRELRFLAVSLLTAWFSKSLAPFCLLASGYIVAMIMGRGLAPLGNIGVGLDKLCRTLSRFPAFATTFLVTAMIIVSSSKLIKHPYSALLLPEREIDFFLEQENWQQFLPLFHTASLGGYVLLRFQEKGNQRASFASSLNHVYPKLAELESKVRDLSPGWERYFRTILSPNSVLAPRNTALAKWLSSSAEWCEVKGSNWEWRLFLKAESCPNVPEDRQFF